MLGRALAHALLIAAGAVWIVACGGGGVVGNLPPQITSQPASVSVVEPATASFSVTALGTPPFTHQWQRSDDGGVTFNDIPGAISGTYTTAATVVAVDNGDRYRVLVGNLEGISISASATLTVDAMSTTGSLALDAFEIAGPPARFEPPTQTGQFGSFVPAAAVTCSLHPSNPNLLQFSALSAPGTQSGRMTFDYDLLANQVQSIGYASSNPAHPDPVRRDEFRYLCLANSPAPQIRACVGVTVNQVDKTVVFADVVLDFEAPSFVIPTPSDIRLNGTLNVPTCFP